MHEYVLLRVTTKESPALRFGAAMHKVLETIWAGGADGHGVADAVRHLIAVSDRIPEDEAAQIAALVEHYRPPLDRYKVESVEQVFDVPIINPATGRQMRGYTLVGKVDALAVDGDGRRWLVEHKTTSDDIVGFGAYWQRLAIDQQIAYYLLATGAEAVLYDVIKKPTIKLCGKDEKLSLASAGEFSPADCYQRRIVQLIKADRHIYYQCREVHKTPDDIADAQQDLWQQAHMLADCAKKGRWPRNANACKSLYGMCPYLGVCVGQASLDDDELFRTKRGSHEELME